MRNQEEGRERGGNPIDIKLINHGVAYYIIDRYRRWIEVNRALLLNPKLYQEVIDHELEHSRATTWLQQYWIDWKDSWNLPKQYRVAVWQLQHPESFTNMLPIIFVRKKLSVNWYTTTFWFLILAAILQLIYIMRRLKWN